jgi:CheY-like chemotaxis protein
VANAPSRRRVLVVEDEAITGLSFCNLVDVWGYGECELAVSPEQAMAALERERPEVLLMDINLGEGKEGGIDLAARIRQEADIPVIFVTGYSDEATRKRASAVSPWAFLVKPVDYDVLRKTLGSVLNSASR